MQEIANVVRFLTKQNVHHDMQNEILKYYPGIKQKQWLLYISYNNRMIYYEFIQYKPIEQIDLINFYKFLYDENMKSYNPDWKMISYNKDGFKSKHYTHQPGNYICLGGGGTKTILKELKKDMYLPSTEFSVVMDNYAEYLWFLCIKEIET